MLHIEDSPKASSTSIGADIVSIGAEGFLSVGKHSSNLDITFVASGIAALRLFVDAALNMSSAKRAISAVTSNVIRRQSFTSMSKSVKTYFRNSEVKTGRPTFRNVSL